LKQFQRDTASQNQSDEGMTEIEASAQLKKSAVADLRRRCFLLPGSRSISSLYPAVIDNLISRGEFYTAYTPYQPEISQVRCKEFSNIKV
jgi:glycine dehydrogenase subunit 1